MIRVGDFLFSLSRKSGELRVIVAQPDRFQEVFASQIFKTDQHYTPPSFADGKLFLRSADEFLAVDLGNASSKP